MSNDETRADRQPMEHVMKCWPEYFQAIADGRKSFEVRRNDRDFREGDVVVLQEFDPKDQTYSGRTRIRTVGYVARGVVVPEGWCVFALGPDPKGEASTTAPGGMAGADFLRILDGHLDAHLANRAFAEHVAIQAVRDDVARAMNAAAPQQPPAVVPPPVHVPPGRDPAWATYYALLERLHVELEIPGCGSFDDCIADLKKRLAPAPAVLPVEATLQWKSLTWLAKVPRAPHGSNYLCQRPPGETQRRCHGCGGEFEPATPPPVQPGAPTETPNVAMCRCGRTLGDGPKTCGACAAFVARQIRDALAAQPIMGGRAAAECACVRCASDIPFGACGGKPFKGPLCDWCAANCSQARPTPGDAGARPAASTFEVLGRLRDAGWSVAVHNDYRLNGTRMTFWGFSRGDRFLKGEGATDFEALAIVADQADIPTVTRLPPAASTPRRPPVGKCEHSIPNNLRCYSCEPG